jgi:hypothetical protein
MALVHMSACVAENTTPPAFPQAVLSPAAWLLALLHDEVHSSFILGTPAWPILRLHAHLLFLHLATTLHLFFAKLASLLVLQDVARSFLSQRPIAATAENIPVDSLSVIANSELVTQGT